MTENNAKSIVELFADRNSGKMVSEIATKEKELEMLREIISLRKTVHGLVESLSEVQKKAKDDLDAAEARSNERYRAIMDRVGSVLNRDEWINERYGLVRFSDDGVKYAFTFDGAKMMEWIRDWTGSDSFAGIPDSLEEFRDSFYDELRDARTLDAIREISQNNLEWANRLPFYASEDLVVDEKEPVCMDEAGVPTTFTRMCSICGEEGRNSRTHKEDPIEVNGRLTHHWI